MKLGWQVTIRRRPPAGYPEPIISGKGREVQEYTVKAIQEWSDDTGIARILSRPAIQQKGLNESSSGRLRNDSRLVSGHPNGRR